MRLATLCMTPVMLPLGRARLATRPDWTGSTLTAVTVGIVRVAALTKGATSPIRFD